MQWKHQLLWFSMLVRRRHSSSKKYTLGKWGLISMPRWHEQNSYWKPLILQHHTCKSDASSILFEFCKFWNSFCTTVCGFPNCDFVKVPHHFWSSFWCHLGWVTFFHRAKILWCCLACKIFLRPLLSPWVLPEMSTVCFCAVASSPKGNEKKCLSDVLWVSQDIYCTAIGKNPEIYFSLKACTIGKVHSRSFIL